MSKKEISVHIIISIILCCLLVVKYAVQAALAVIPFLSAIPGINQAAGAVGIIGGADGPTAVFLSAPVQFLLVLPVIEFAAVVYILVILFRCYHIIAEHSVS